MVLLVVVARTLMLSVREVVDALYQVLEQSRYKLTNSCKILSRGQKESD